VERSLRTAIISVAVAVLTAATTAADWNAAVAAYQAHDRKTAARELAATARGLAEAQARLDRLRAKIRELESARKTLQELGDADGVRAVSGQIKAQRKALAAVDANLSDVRAALKNL